MNLVNPPQFCIIIVSRFSVVPLEIEDNGDTKFWGKQGALWSMSKWLLEPNRDNRDNTMSSHPLLLAFSLSNHVS